ARDLAATPRAGTSRHRGERRERNARDGGGSAAPVPRVDAPGHGTGGDGRTRGRCDRDRAVGGGSRRSAGASARAGTRHRREARVKLGGRETRAVWWSDAGIHFVDQRAIPHSLEIGLARSSEEAAEVIRSMGVRGAPLIGVFAAYALALAARRGEPLEVARTLLGATRPTAINLHNGLAAAMRGAPDGDAMLAAARAYDDAEVAAAEAIGRHGLALF